MSWIGSKGPHLVQRQRNRQQANGVLKRETINAVQNTKPVMIPAGAQIPTQGKTHLRDNLFGRQEILDKFAIVMSKGSIELHQTGGGGSNALGLSLPHRPIGDKWDYKSDLDDGCPFSNC